MKSSFNYVTKGLAIFLIVDIISAFAIMLIWNTLVAWNTSSTVNFIQCLGVVIIYDVFSIVEMKRKDLNEKLDKESKQ